MARGWRGPVLAALLFAGCGGGASSTTTVGAKGHEPPLKAAEATVRARGYYPTDISAYDPRASLAVILGVKKGSADATAQRAFFFANGRLAGTDTPTDSSGIRIASVRAPVIGLEYALYSKTDPQCCPTGGSATVRYRWDGERVEPLDRIPPGSFEVGRSRR